VLAVTISTERLDLLPLRVEHAAEMAAVLGDPALHTFIGGTPETPEGLLARYERLVAGPTDPTVSWLNWVVSLRAEGRLTGYVQATITPDPLGSVAEVAWVIGTSWQGRGIATEAAQGLVGWLEDRADLIIAHVHPDHAASAVVAAACGLAPTEHVEDGEIRWSRSVARRL
jgi:RimJ/RimL family protein N-acetyltransferase